MRSFFPLVALIVSTSFADISLPLIPSVSERPDSTIRKSGDRNVLDPIPLTEVGDSGSKKSLQSYSLQAWKTVPNASFSFDNGGAVTGAQLMGYYAIPLKRATRGTLVFTGSASLNGTHIPKDSAVALSAILNRGGDLNGKFGIGYSASKDSTLGLLIKGSGSVYMAKTANENLGYGALGLAMQVGFPIIYFSVSADYTMGDLLDDTNASHFLSDAVIYNAEATIKTPDNNYLVFAYVAGEKVKSEFSLKIAKSFAFFDKI